MPISPQFEALVRAHLADEPDGNDRRAIWSWLSNRDEASLVRAFAEPIVFGTAGLRAEVGPGPARMNLRNVMRATRALLEVLELRVPRARERGIAVGFDARPSSSAFAAAVRAVCTAAGFVVHAFDEPIPTPIVAFAAAELETAAAVVITASHNPPGDNGMKVYGPTASLIVAPWDREIADRMHDERTSPEMTGGERAVELTRSLGEAVVARHRARCLAIGATGSARAPIRVAYTALHGVGEEHVRAVLAGLTPPGGPGEVSFASVAEQATPDGTFPTTPMPNPEEPSALARVLALAAETRASLVIANDPDADRAAVGVLHDDSLVMLHGDELGVLFGDHLLRVNQAPSPFVVTTIVSSRWLPRIAESLGVRAEITLTGHKWIHARASELVREGGSFVFGYEEALGYAFDDGVHDKDGIAAAVLAARIAGEERARGRTLVDRLETIAREHGLYRSRSISLRVDEHPDSLARLRSAVDRLRAAPPSSLGGTPRTRCIDGFARTVRERDGGESVFALPASPLVAFEFGDRVRVIARPSGTEPKIKLYVDYATHLAADERYLAARARADSALDALMPELRGWLAG